MRIIHRDGAWLDLLTVASWHASMRAEVGDGPGLFNALQSIVGIIKAHHGVRKGAPS